MRKYTCVCVCWIQGVLLSYDSLCVFINKKKLTACTRVMSLDRNDPISVSFSGSRLYSLTSRWLVTWSRSDSQVLLVLQLEKHTAVYERYSPPHRKPSRPRPPKTGMTPAYDFFNSLFLNICFYTKSRKHLILFRNLNGSNDRHEKE